jgi:hypothetical protein
MTKDMEDLRERLTKAKQTLATLALEAKIAGDLDRQLHLESKAEGVALAFDYTRLYE